MTFDRRLIVDTRERVRKGKLGSIKAAKRLAIDVGQQTMDVGDIRGGRLICEKKLFMDFVNSFIAPGGDGWKQMKELLQYCDDNNCIPMLGIVQGTQKEVLEDLKTLQRYIGGVSLRKSFQILGEVKVRYPELLIVWVPDEMNLIQMVFDMAIAIDAGLIGIPKTVMLKKYVSIRNKKVQTLCNVFRIPIKEAKACVIYAGGLRMLFKMTQKQIARIPGVSWTTAKKIGE